MFSRRFRIDTTKDTQFNDAWFVLAAIVTAVGVIFDNAFLTAAAVLLLAIAGVAWVWSAFSFYGVHYRRRFSEVRAFRGETIRLTLEVQNQKFLPLTWLTIRDKFPTGLPVSGRELPVSPTTNQAEFSTFWMPGPFQRVTRHFDVACVERGFFRYGPTELATGDGFGFFGRNQVLTDEERLIVYPTLYSVTELGLPTKNPFGETRAQGRLFEDPLRTVGIREWQEYDMPRRIHWKATARQQTLLSRIYEPSEEQQVQIILNVATLERHWHGYLPELQERTISVAGSLAALATEERLPVGIVANGALPGGDQPIRLLPGRSPDQLVRILELLAAVTPFATGPIEQMLQHEAARLPWGATLVLVTAIAHEELLASMLDLSAAGRQLVLFTLAEEAPTRLLDNIAVYHLPHLVDDLITPALVQPGNLDRPTPRPSPPAPRLER
jgi:uncharacterized protein (DUF58 family)